MVQHGRAVEERQLPLPRLGKKRQELLVKQDEYFMFSCKAQLVAPENIAAQNGQRRLVDGLVIVRNAGQDQAEDPVRDLGLRLGQGVHRLAQREQRYARRPDGRAAGKLPDGIYRFAQLLFRQHAKKLPQIRRDEPRDLFLSGLQLTGQVDGDLIDLVNQQTRRNAQKCVSCRLTDGQMLADAQEIGEVQRRVERGLWMGQDIFPQDIDLRQLDGPWDRVFQIAQVNM